MADEQETIAPVALETPASALEATTTPEAVEPEPVNLEAPEQETVTEPEPTETEAVDDTDDLEFGFKKYRVPKELKAAVEDWRAATTKKEQSVAEQAKALEAQAAKQVEADETELAARAELHGIKAQLAEYAKLTPQDWQAHMLNDPLGTQQAKMHFDLLKEQKAALEGTIEKTQGERTQRAQQLLAKRVEETIAAAPKIIPGWTPENSQKTIGELVAFAQSEGIPDQVLQDNWSPQLLKLLHRAHLGHNLLTKQATAPKIPTPQPKPLETVNGTKSAPTSGDLAALDMEAYAAARRKGVGGKPAF